MGFCSGFYFKACDDFIPEPERKADLPLILPVEQVLAIPGGSCIRNVKNENGRVFELRSLRRRLYLKVHATSTLALKSTVFLAFWLLLPGKGTVVTGRMEQGKLKGGESIEIVGMREKPIKAQIGALEMFRKTLDEAQAGDQVCSFYLSFSLMLASFYPHTLLEVFELVFRWVPL